MASKSEVEKLIREENGRFARSLSSDIRPVEVSVVPGKLVVPGQALIKDALLGQGLGGQVQLFHSDSRREPIGLPIHMPGERDGILYAVGLYIPAAADRSLGGAGEIDARVNKAMEMALETNRSKKLKLPFGDGLISVTTSRLSYWSERGMHPTVNTDHSTHATAEDEAYQNRRNEEMLVRYVGALLDSTAQMKMYGLKPRDLADPTEPIRQVGKQTTILVPAFGSVDHSSMKDLVGERDRWRCSMPIARQVAELGLNADFPGEEKIPTCGRDLINYYPFLWPNKLRIVLGEASCVEANHVLPRGAAMVATVKGALSGIIEDEVLRKPEKLLLTLGLLNIAELASSNGIDLVNDGERILRSTVGIMPLADAAVNNLGNLETADSDHHHGWYHPDELLIDSITGFIDGVNKGVIPVYRNNVPAFEGWRAEHQRLILDGHVYPGFDADYQSKMGLLHVARSMVMMQKVPYWQDETTQISAHLVRSRTREFVHTRIIEGERKVLAKMSVAAGEHGAELPNAEGVKELVREFYGVRKKVSKKMHPGRRGDKGPKLLKNMGLEP